MSWLDRLPSPPEGGVYPADAFARSAGYVDWADAVAAVEAGHAVAGFATAAVGRTGKSMFGLKLLAQAISELQARVPEVRISVDEHTACWTLRRVVSA